MFWIDVKEKMPQPGSFVIVYNCALDAVIGGIFYDTWSDNAGDNFDSGDITHWMPFPPKPPTSNTTNHCTRHRTAQ